MHTTHKKRGSEAVLTSNERLMVDDFTGVIRKHSDEDPTTLARLLTVAFDLSVGFSESRQNKLARAALRGLETRQELAEAEGGSFSSEEVARILGISKTAVLKRLKKGRLLAWREERLQAARFPRWQFDKYGQVYPGFEEVLGILNRDKRLDEWGKLLFFLEQKYGLRGCRPLDALREGKKQDVILAAKAYAE